MIAAFIKWLASFYDEDSNNSYSRAITTVIVVFVLLWDTSFIVWTHTLPSELALAAEAAFMTCFYVIRRAAGAYSDKQNANVAVATGTTQSEQKTS